MDMILRDSKNGYHQVCFHWLRRRLLVSEDLFLP